MIALGATTAKLVKKILEIENGGVLHKRAEAAVSTFDLKVGAYDSESSKLRIIFTTSYSMVLLFTVALLLLNGNRSHPRSLVPISVVIGYRILIALAVLFIGIFVTSLTEFQLLLTVSMLALSTLIVGIASLQKTGKDEGTDTITHTRFGLR